MADKNYTIDSEGNIIFDAEETKVFQPAPLGDYLLQIESAEMREGPKAPYIALEMKIVHEDEDINDTTVWDNVSLKAPWKLTQLARSMGQDVPEGSQAQLNVFDLFGEIIEARLIVATNNKNRLVNEVDQYLPRGTVAGEPPQAPEKAAPKTKSAPRKRKASS